MPEPQIVPPTPQVNQTQADSPEKIAEVTKSVQDIFDRVMPKVGGAKDESPPAQTPPPSTPPVSPTPPVTPPAQTPEQPVQPPDAAKPPAEQPTHKTPSFIDEILKGTAETSVTPPASTPPAEDEWPEELPQFKTPDEASRRYKNWRIAHQKLREENKTLRERPPMDEQTTQRMTFLENKVKEQDSQLSAMSVNMHPEFQQRIIAPMRAAWNEAARIVKESGGNPDQLAKAMALTGKSQYEALDEVFENIPESAKVEAHQAITAYRRLDEQRKGALANAPRTVEELKKRDYERQMQYLDKQRKEMGSMFDDAIRVLRDEAKIEILQKSNDPEAGWWNQQADDTIDTARKLFLDNNDLKRMAFAVAMAPMADVYRRLWLSERQARTKSDAVIRDRLGAEPSLSESGGNQPVPGMQPSMAEDLKKPFSEVFLREFHKQRASGVR